MNEHLEDDGVTAGRTFGGLLHRELEELERRIMVAYTSMLLVDAAANAGLGLMGLPKPPPVSSQTDDLLLSCGQSTNGDGPHSGYEFLAQANLKPFEVSVISPRIHVLDPQKNPEPTGAAPKVMQRYNRVDTATAPQSTEDDLIMAAPKEQKKKPPQAKLFQDLNEMKENLKNKPRYDVKEFYYEKGFWQWLAKHQLFENFTLGVIAVNALWMAIDTDNNTSETLLSAHPVFQVAEHTFCVYFTFEWFTRFMAFKKKSNGCKDAWFVFDSVLVFMMVMETWVLTLVMILTASPGGASPLGNASILRLLRLARLSRMARMLRSMPELLILIKGMVAAMRSVGFVLLLLLIMMYVFSIAFVQLMKGTDAGNARFPGIPASMYTLLTAGTFMDDITGVANELGRESMVCATLFFTFVGLSALTVMNMLIGVLCEVVSSVAEFEKESMAIAGMRESMEEIWTSIDDDGTGQLSKEEFEKMLTNQKAWEALAEVDVDPISLVSNADQIFEVDQETGEEPTLSVEEFMEVILEFRGTNKATVKDMNELRKWMAGTIQRTDRKLDQMLLSLNVSHSAYATPRPQEKMPKV